MKKTVMFVLVFVCLGFATFAQSTDISGRWVAPFRLEGAPATMVLNLQVSGEQVTGTIVHPRAGEMQIENGKLSGDTLTFDAHPARRKVDLHFTGSVSSDTIQMQLQVNGQQDSQALKFHRSEQ